MENVQHCISAQQWKRSDLESLFTEASRLKKIFLTNDSDGINQEGRMLSGKRLATVFYEPSTRTRFSFEAAMQALGGTVLSTENASAFSSVIKGESLEDTVRVLAGYADCIVLRHHESGSASRAAEVSNVPIINAGDGAGQHPTQSLLDVFTIQDRFGSIDGIRIAIMGDLLYGRTAHSLAYMLAKSYKDIYMYLVSPDMLRMRSDVLEYLGRKTNVVFKEALEMETVLPMCDVVYQTRIQKERFGDRIGDYDQVRGIYTIGVKEMNLMRHSSILMHPLPRVDEIHPDVDADPRAVYFEQARNGLYVRMALLKKLLLK